MNFRAPTDTIARLRFVLENIPSPQRYQWSTAKRTEVLKELYASFWGTHQETFMVRTPLPPGVLLSQIQQESPTFSDPVESLGQPCGHIFKKGENCYRCRDCGLDDSCVLCSQCFHSSDHTDHNVTFYLTQQPGGCCDCGDPEAWKTPITCQYHRSPERSLAPSWRPQPVRSAIPQDLRDSMSRTIAYALDFVLDTLDFSPEEMTHPTTEPELKSQVTACPTPTDSYAVVLWNDEKHSFDDVIHHVQDATGCSPQAASDVADRVDAEGRDIVEISLSIPRLLHIAQTIAQIDLGVTVRRVFDTCREEISATIIEWLLDLSSCRIGSDAVTIREIIAAELYTSRKKDSSSLTSNPDAGKVYGEIEKPARLHWMFLYHTRLWKRPRLNLKQLYVALLSISRDHKLAIATHFATVYHRIIDAYLLVDREIETSIKYFAVQLFTVPSVAAHLVRNNDIITRLHSIITAFFTNQVTDKRLTLPPNRVAEIDVDSAPFRSKRFMPVFSDLRYICTNSTVQELISSNPLYIMQFCKVCQLFMGVNPNKRAAATHVEYETDSWINVFNVTLSLSRVVKVYGEAFVKGTTQQLVYVIAHVIGFILSVCTLSERQLDRMKYFPIAFHDVEFNGALYNIVDFDVLTGWVSFHHSLHWLLAELFKHVDLLRDEALSEIGYRNLSDVITRNIRDQAFLIVLDFPLRVLAMTAQIRNGLWVRNGFAIRGQLLHYRDFMLRELCYDQDVYILQCCFVILDPSIVIVSVLDRFQLLDWFSGGTEHPVYEGPQLSGMVEEFLYLLITCLSETGSATNLQMHDIVKREIVHGLALGPCTHTDLTKRVAERIAEEASFDRALKEVSNFKAPDGISDSGIYELKDEMYDEVNPFFFHYTRNRREEVEGILKARQQKKTGETTPVLVPKPLGITSGPFSILSLVFHSDVLLQVIFFLLHNVVSYTNSADVASPSVDALVDQGLHLVMLALVEQPEPFSQLAARKSFKEGRTLIHELSDMELNDKFRSSKPKVEWCLTKMAGYVPSQVGLLRRKPEASEDRTSKEDAKKRAAKARQEAIMKQFAAAQKTFFDNFDEDDMDDEGDETLDAEPAESLGVCIMCQEDVDRSRPFGALGLIQPSKTLRWFPEGDSFIETLAETISGPSTWDRPLATSQHAPTAAEKGKQKRQARPVSKFGFTGFPPKYFRFGLHNSFCGHFMHMDCFAAYNHSIGQRHQQQPQRNHPENIERREFVCPLCKSLGNVILPIPEHPPLIKPSLTAEKSVMADWMRAVGIEALKAPLDRKLAALQYPNGTGEFVFWSAEDSDYPRPRDDLGWDDGYKMLTTLRTAAQNVSSQSAHLRDRRDPPSGERGAGMYLPEDLCAYTISSIEVAQRGIGNAGSSIAHNMNDTTIRLIRSTLACLSGLAALQFRDRPDGGRTAIRLALLKRVLPEWVREFKQPLLLRDPFAVLVESAAVASDMLQPMTVLLYYASLARTTIGLLMQFHQAKVPSMLPPADKQYSHIFGDVGIFVRSVARHAPQLDQVVEYILSALTEARFERLLYAHSLPFLRRAAILKRAITTTTLPTPSPTNEPDEYVRLLDLLEIPPLRDLAQHESILNALGGWSAHFGHAYSPAQATIKLEYTGSYNLTQLPYALDSLIDEGTALVCKRCNTAPTDAAICMLCGAICCFQLHCCVDPDNQAQGECNMHTRECGGIIGLYFLVKRCAMLYLSAENGTFGPSPYLDIHGEVDMAMRRGHWQYIHPQRMEELRKTWLNHGIPTYIARKLEPIADTGGWDTV
ncbi:hypothetical protein BOTBODRAFT_185706 [Botryobasidium botryosum FD-172 SS1]|uniref:E3 ubiquitin-protein ligase n=1 Tax=Botryobasidium botryosum (strain FD-172 SS1) TaxID=930990 RepID=A0A067MP62_BOTB1|nr:hypothetical protein BOTBODRAFT_185706 [Botryobasidium botryosum FD-172 SS1]